MNESAWTSWFAWYPVKLENNDHAKISGTERWVWMRVVYKRRVYIHLGEHGISGYNVYSDIQQ